MSDKKIKGTTIFVPDDLHEKIRLEKMPREKYFEFIDRKIWGDKK